MDRFVDRLSKWKREFLSSGGKLVLCKSALGSLGTYLFSLYKAPRGLPQKLEGLRRKFFWGNNAEKRKIVWVAWSNTLNSKINGRLGLGSLRAQNLALLAKWWWRFKTEKEALWKRVVVALHGTSGLLDNRDMLTGNSSTWGKISRLGNELSNYNIDLKNLFKKNMGDGRDRKFWTDDWTGNGPFEETFLRLAALDANKDCLVTD